MALSPNGSDDKDCAKEKEYHPDEDRDDSRDA
jgi:hypothetical protein